MPIYSIGGLEINPGAYTLALSSENAEMANFEYFLGIPIRPVIKGTTKISLPKPSEYNQDPAIYNLYGIKVADNIERASSLPPGIYIAGGKKFVIK